MEQLRLDGGADPYPITTAPVAPVVAAAEIARLRASGLGWGLVARSLNARGVATPSGRGVWHKQSAYRYVHRTAWAAYMRQYRAVHGRG